MNTILLIIGPGINIGFLLLNLFINKFMLEMAAFRLRNKLMRRISRMDLIIMILILGVITLHTIPDKLTSPLDLIYLSLTCIYSLCLFLDTIIDSPFIHADTTRVYRTLTFILISISVYTAIAKIGYAYNIMEDVKHFINILIAIPLSAKLASLFDELKISNELHISDLIPDYSI